MIRIRGRIGDWPVDLEIELDEQDWRQLAQQTAAVTRDPERSAPAPDPLWQTARQLLAEAGEVDGPTLLAQLRGLAGSDAAAKRLLVRLRHDGAVSVQQGADAPLYRWVGEAAVGGRRPPGGQ